MKRTFKLHGQAIPSLLPTKMPQILAPEIVISEISRDAVFLQFHLQKYLHFLNQKLILYWTLLPDQRSLCVTFLGKMNSVKAGTRCSFKGCVAGIKSSSSVSPPSLKELKVKQKV